MKLLFNQEETTKGKTIVEKANQRAKHSLHQKMKRKLYGMVCWAGWNEVMVRAQYLKCSFFDT